MKLHRAERDNYVLTIVTDPPLEGTWEASFDGGNTWHDGDPASGTWTWLVAGPDFELPGDPGWTDEGVQLTHSVKPLLRVKDNPILDVQEAPETITLWR
jgi:hypothetical protein